MIVHIFFMYEYNWTLKLEEYQKDVNDVLWL